MSDEKGQWYTNKELFKICNELNQKIIELSVELEATQQIVKKYNNLNDTINILRNRLNAIDYKSKGRQSIEASILRWMPVIIALGALALNYLGA